MSYLMFVWHDLQADQSWNLNGNKKTDLTRVSKFKRMVNNFKIIHPKQIFNQDKPISGVIGWRKELREASVEGYKAIVSLGKESNLLGPEALKKWMKAKT